MTKFALVFSSAILCCFNLLNAQSTPQTSILSAEDIDIQVTYAEYLGKTAPLRNLVHMAPADPVKRAQNKANRKEIFNFAGRGKYEAVNPNALPQGPDPIRQSIINPNRSSLIPVEPLVNIDGMSDSNFGGNPPDPTIDVGKDYVLQMINATLLQVRDKEGNAVSNPIAANTIWSQVGFSSAGDPIVLYDQEAERWIITEFPSGNQLLFAISETSDPLGSWMAWNFATPSFPDYPKYSIWSNAYCVTTNEQGPSTLPNYFIDREAILNGDASVAIQRITIPGVGTGPGFQVSTPVDWTGPLAPPTDAHPMILNLNDDAWSGSISEDRLVISTFDIDFDNSANTTVTSTLLPTAPFDTNPCSATGPGFACIPQLGGSGLDGLPEVIMNQVHYRNFGSYEAMVLNFITDVTGSNLSGIRWMELRRMPGGDWTVYQEGTFAPDDGLDRFMAGICMDGAGNIGLAYNVSSAETNVGVRFTGRRASDPLGEMTVDEFILAEGENAINSGSRFGDYSHMSVDPTNDRTFWFTTQYAEGGGWSTRIAAFELRRDTTDLGPTALLSPQSDPELGVAETVSIEIKNFGLDTPTVFQVGYIFENGAPVVESIDSTLYPDSTYMHTFAATVDMSTIGDYEFKIFTNVLNDQSPLNDTLRTVISKLSRNDAGISDIVGLEGVNCGETLPATLVITNFGTDTLFSATVSVTFNGTLLDPINWVGTLLPGESEIINITLENIQDGSNSIIATTSLPNGMIDEIQVNDAFSRDFEAITNGVEITLRLLTDNFPAETTWEVNDLSGNTLYEGGPYNQQAALIEESFCLDPEDCYNFTIFDSYGDGICCGFGQGNYEIVDDSGLPLASSDGQFGASQTLGFCATFVCSVAAEFTYAPETEDGNADGVIMIEVTSGVGPFQYSIDGGTTFQGSNTFTGLTAGDYNIVIIDDAECDFTAIATVPACALDAMATVTNETDTDGNGGISLSASNGNPPFQYSIDGGDNFQFNSIFINLAAGDYIVVVVDALGCRSEMVVTVDQIVPTTEIDFGHIIEVFPNPTEGVARINIQGINQSSVFLPYEVFDAMGKLVQTSQLTRYNDTFTGQLSLVNYASGTYYVRFGNKEIKRLVRLVKQ